MPQSAEYGTSDWLTKATELKRVVIYRLAAMPETERAAVTSPGGWSASEVVEHLILVEETIPSLWRERLLSVSSSKLTFRSVLLSRIISFVFSKTGLRVPTVTELEPTGGLELDALESRWSEARSRLVAALPENPNGPWVLHPAFGPLSSAQMGRVLTSHLEHHLQHWPTNSSPPK
jgi:hypothetical protein